MYTSKKNKYGKLLYKRGYLFSQAEVRSPIPTWTKKTIGGYHIYFDPENQWGFAQEGHNWVALLGRAIDTLHWTSDINFIARTCLDRLILSEEKLLDYIDHLAGRFLLIYRNSGKTKLMTDAFGTRSAFYFLQEPVMVASHYMIIRILLKPERCGLIDMIKLDRTWEVGTNYGLPGILTPLEGVYILTPNTLLNVEERKIQRFYPRRELPAGNLDDVAEGVSAMLKRELELLHKENNLAISISSGIDSRVTFAAARDIAKEVMFFTYGDKFIDPTIVDTSPIADTEFAKPIARMIERRRQSIEADLLVASEMAQALELRHIRIEATTWPEKDFQYFLYVMDCNTYHRHKRNLAKAYLEQLPPDLLHIRSNLGGIAKANIRRRGFTDLPLTAERMAQAWKRNMGDNKQVAEAFHQFAEVTEFANIMNYDPYDMLFWEHYYGTWYSCVLLESDVAFDTFELLNSRAVAEMILSAPVEDRMAYSVHLQLIRRLWPVLLQWPINQMPLNIQLKDLSDELATVRAERKALVAELGSTRKQAERLKAEQLKTEQSKRISEQSKLKSEQAKLKAEQSRLKAEQSKLKAEQKALTAELGDTRKQVEQLKAEQTKLKAERQSLTTELNATKKKVERVKTERHKRTTELQAVKRSFSYRLGSLLVQAVRKPGRNTLLLPYDMFRLGIRRMKATSTQNKATRLSANKARILEEIRERIKAIKQNSGARISSNIEPRRKDLKIAVILDTFTYDCFKYEAELITFTPDNWKQTLTKHRPHFLLVESAWQGNGSTWKYQIVNLGQNLRSQLPELVRWCQAQDVPTAFWSKEDPVHYHEFLDAARLFDYIYTSDLNCVPKYKRDLQHENVYCLPFAVQPKIHNPIGSVQKIRDIAFAGSWYEGETGYRKNRREQMSHILAPALQYGVDIYDRHYKLNDSRYRFPEQYQPYIVGELPYNEMTYAYKMYRIFLNVSSVIDSPTMLPRRVLEILASGTCVLSGYCKGIDNLVGSDTVPMSSSPRETELHLQKLLEDNDIRDRLASQGLRKIMREHTCEKRLDYILETMPVKQPGETKQKKGISVVTCTSKPNNMENIFANYDRQKYDNKEMIIILNNNLLDIDKWMEEAQRHPSVTVYRVDENKPLGVCLNFAVDKAGFDYIAKFDDDDYYAPAYLEDMMNALDYSGADIAGKGTYYVYFETSKVLAIRFPDEEHQFRRLVSGATMVIKRRVFEKVRFDPVKEYGSDTQFQKKCLQRGLRIYSADRFNFVAVRKADAAMHTWQASDKELLSGSQIVCHTEDYVEHVIC